MNQVLQYMVLITVLKHTISIPLMVPSNNKLSKRQTDSNSLNETISREIQDIFKLLNIIRQFESIESSINELNQEVGTSNKRLPTNEIVYDYDIMRDNTIKQQTVLPSSASSSISFSTSTTEKITQPSLSSLEESFGSLPVRASKIETTVAPPKNGFYYLVDWNTIFDVDDQKGNRVNLRFQPTIGDSKQFLSVSVP